MPATAISAEVQNWRGVAAVEGSDVLEYREAVYTRGRGFAHSRG